MRVRKKRRQSKAEAWDHQWRRGSWRCEGAVKGLGGGAESEERDGIAGMGGVADRAGEVMDVPWGLLPSNTGGCSGPLQWPDGKGGKGEPLVA